MAKTLNARIITKHDTAENWEKATSFKPKLGEIIVYDTDDLISVPKIKIGNEINLIKDLPFITDPYVLKDGNKVLSTHDYTTSDWEKVQAIPNNPNYENTTYTAGADLGLDGTSFYNKGVVEIRALANGDSFEVITRTGPSKTDSKPIQISKLSNNSYVQEQIGEFLTENLFNYITSGEKNGTIKVSENEIAVNGLKELAFMTLADISSDLEEVAIITGEGQSISSTIKIWYDVDSKKLYYRLPDDYNNGNNSENRTICPDTVTKILQSEEKNGYITVETQDNDSYDVPVFTGGTITDDTIFSSDTASNSTDTGAVCITGGLGVGGNIYGKAFSGAVYNDYAEYRQSEEPIEPGYIVYSGDDGILHKTVGRLQFFEGVVSDTFGFSIGKTDKSLTPLAVAGRVLVYTDEELHAGNVVCAGPHGKACKMTKQEIKDHPDRIVGIVSEVPSYKTWGEENIPVNGRVWIRVK